MVGSTLSRHRSKPRVYIGCMKSGPVLAQKWAMEYFQFSLIIFSFYHRCWSSLSLRGVKYHEPEYWKFGEEGNKYFRHATGQIYALSKDLATYISVNRWAFITLSFYTCLYNYMNSNCQFQIGFLCVFLLEGNNC